MKPGALRLQLRAIDPIRRTGRVRKIMSTHIEASGPNVPVGTLCTVEASSNEGTSSFTAEVVCVDEERVVLSPFGNDVASYSGALVTASPWRDMVPVGAPLLGRVVDALGRPSDGCGELSMAPRRSLQGPMPSPLERVSSAEILQTGIRAIDGLLTLGKGQRIGIFAASGVGKTTLITQLACQLTADVLVICLVGERGREVESIWQRSLASDARGRATLVAATSDQSAAMRVRVVHYAGALAEYWRQQGKHVLLVIDSATRLAMALREVGLAAGEPPTVRAYTPNVFATIPAIVERCGALKSGGAITAIMTVLSETDQMDDPVCELMKSLLDGHILLSRDLAEQGHFPAIDVCRSVSRQAEDLASQENRRRATQVLEWLSLQQSSRTLVKAGLYVKGAHQSTDRALERHPAITRFLRQSRSENVPLTSVWAQLADIVGGANG